MNKVEMKGSVILNPVPVVLVTSKNKEGKTNVFTVGWTGTINTKPPMLYISIRPERLSYEYIKETMEFVVNLPGSNLVKAVTYRCLILMSALLILNVKLKISFHLELMTCSLLKLLDLT